MSREDSGKVSWNIASAQAMHISNLISKATTKYLNGDLGNWYWTLSALRENINQDVGSDDREFLNDLEKECNLLVGSWQRYSKERANGKLSKEAIEKKNEFSQKVRTYQRKLMDLLKELGYLPNKENRARLSF